MTRTARLFSATLLLGLIAGLPLRGSAQAGLRVNAPNSQTPVSAIGNRRGALCDPCVIRAFDGGFARIDFEDIAPQAGDLRLRATLRIDPNTSVIAPNGQGGTTFVRPGELGVNESAWQRRVNVRVVLTARNPVTGETSRHEVPLSAGSGSPTVTNVRSGTSWPAVHRRVEEVGDVTRAYNDFGFTVAEIIWESVDLGGVRYIDSAVRRQLETAARDARRAQAADSARRAQAADSAARASREAAEAEASELGEGAGAEGGATSGGTAEGEAGGATAGGSGGGAGTATSAGSAGRPASVSSGGSGTRPPTRTPAQEIADRQRREQEMAEAIAPAMAVAVSLLGDLLPDGTFSTIGISGLGGSVGTGFFLDGGPGWKLTPRNAVRHVAISAPSLILGFNGPNLGDFTSFHEEVGEPGPTNKPATVSQAFSLGLGGNFYMDLPINRTALNIAAYHVWSGDVVEPAYDQGSSGMWMLRSEIVKAIPTPRAYSRYGTEWAIAAGFGLQSQRVNWTDSNGDQTRSRLGPFFSLRFMMVND